MQELAKEVSTSIERGWPTSTLAPPAVLAKLAALQPSSEPPPPVPAYWPKLHPLDHHYSLPAQAAPSQQRRSSPARRKSPAPKHHRRSSTPPHLRAPSPRATRDSPAWPSSRAPLVHSDARGSPSATPSPRTAAAPKSRLAPEPAGPGPRGENGRIHYRTEPLQVWARGWRQPSPKRRRSGSGGDHTPRTPTPSRPPAAQELGPCYGSQQAQPPRDLPQPPRGDRPAPCFSGRVPCTVSDEDLFSRGSSQGSGWGSLQARHSSPAVVRDYPRSQHGQRYSSRQRLPSRSRSPSPWHRGRGSRRDRH